MEIKDNMKDQRLIVKNILQHQFEDKESLKAIDIFHKNIETQDKHFIDKLKEEIYNDDLLGWKNKRVLKHYSKIIDKLSGYALGS